MRNNYLENRREWPKLEGLRLTPYAYQKLMFCLHRDDVEVSGFGVSDEDDPLLVLDFMLVEQECSASHTAMTEEGIAEYGARMLGFGYEPARCMRIWIHTHPRIGARPSGVDEGLFRDLYGNYSWSVMAIVDKDHKHSATLKFTAGPGSRIEIPFGPDTVEWQYLYPADTEAWEDEYERCVFQSFTPTTQNVYVGGQQGSSSWWDDHVKNSLPSMYSKGAEQEYVDELLVEEDIRKQGYLEDIDLEDGDYAIDDTDWEYARRAGK